MKSIKWKKRILQRVYQQDRKLLYKLTILQRNNLKIKKPEMKNGIQQQIPCQVKQISFMSYFKNIYYTNLENLHRMENFLDINQLPNLNQDLINHLSRPMIPKEFGRVIKCLSTEVSQD